MCKLPFSCTWAHGISGDWAHGPMGSAGIGHSGDWPRWWLLLVLVLWFCGRSLLVLVGGILLSPNALKLEVVASLEAVVAVVCLLCSLMRLCFPPPPRVPCRRRLPSPPALLPRPCRPSRPLPSLREGAVSVVVKCGPELREREFRYAKVHTAAGSDHHSD